MRCEEIMEDEVEWVTPDDSVQEAAQLMRDRNIGFLPVCDPSGRVAGVLTDRDIAVRAVAAALPTSTKVADIMTREVVACRPEDDVRFAEELLARHKKSRIMCIDEQGELCGVISLSDIAQVEAGERVGETLRQVTQREAEPQPRRVT